MPPSRTRYVTACQQLLALGVVVAALTPAASVVSLDVVRQTPGSVPAPGARGGEERLRPGRLGPAVPWVRTHGEAGRGALGGVRRVEVPRVGVRDQDQ
jgi:hypothetical protein